MKGLICNAYLMLTSLYFFGKKENRTWGKDVLFNIIDDFMDVTAVIEEFTNVNKDDAVLALDGFVDEGNCWDFFLIKVSIMCDVL